MHRPPSRAPVRAALAAAAPPHRPAAPDRPVRRGVPGLRRGRARRRDLPALRAHDARAVRQAVERLRRRGTSRPGPDRRRPPGRALRRRQSRQVPIADVQQAGRYDILSAACPCHRPSARAARPHRRRAGQAAGQAQVHVSYDKRQILIICAIALAVIAVAAAAIGWIIAGRVLRPLSTITAAARRIAASSLHERLALRGPDDELKELGRHPRRPVRAAGGLVRRPAAVRRQRLARAAHPADQGTHPAPGHPGRPGRHRRHLAGRQPGTARLQRRAGTPHRGAAHPGQQRGRPGQREPARPGRHHQRGPGRRPARDQPPRPARPGRHPARRPRR